MGVKMRGGLSHRWVCLLFVGYLQVILNVRGAPTDVIVPEQAAADEVLLENVRPNEAERLAKLGLSREHLKAVQEENLVERMPEREAEDLRRLATPSAGYNRPTQGTAELRTFWNCAKPSCTWKENVKPAPVDGSVVASCDISGNKLSTADGASILGGGGDLDAVSYTCPDQVPEYDAATDLLYAFASASTSCCACYELSFTREQFSYNAAGRQCTQTDVRNGDANCILSQNLKIPDSQVGKRMLIQVLSSNDDNNDHFDIMVPGSGLKTEAEPDQVTPNCARYLCLTSFHFSLSLSHTASVWLPK